MLPSVPAQQPKFLKVYRFVTAVSIVLLGIVSFYYRDFLQSEISLRLNELPVYVSAFCTILIIALGTILLIPSTLLFLMTGAIFGFYFGAVLNVLGFAIGSTVAFLIARIVAYDYVIAHSHQYISKISDAISLEGWRAVAFLRVFPVFPAFLVNYLLGVTSIRTFDFAWASAVFIIPGCLVMTYIGATGRELLNNELNLPENLVIAGLVLSCLVIVVIVRRRWSRQQQQTVDK